MRKNFIWLFVGLVLGMGICVISASILYFYGGTITSTPTTTITITQTSTLTSTRTYTPTNSPPLSTFTSSPTGFLLVTNSVQPIMNLTKTSTPTKTPTPTITLTNAPKKSSIRISSGYRSFYLECEPTCALMEAIADGAGLVVETADIPSDATLVCVINNNMGSFRVYGVIDLSEASRFCSMVDE